MTKPARIDNAGALRRLAHRLQPDRSRLSAQ